jgi:hypothetical protein
MRRSRRACGSAPRRTGARWKPRPERYSPPPLWTVRRGEASAPGFTNLRGYRRGRARAALTRRACARRRAARVIVLDTNVVVMPSTMAVSPASWRARRPAWTTCEGLGGLEEGVATAVPGQQLLIALLAQRAREPGFGVDWSSLACLSRPVTDDPIAGELPDDVLDHQLDPDGSISLARDLVAGSRRVPSPATGATATQRARRGRCRPGRVVRVVSRPAQRAGRPAA